MQDAASDIRRIPLPRTPVNKPAHTPWHPLASTCSRKDHSFGGCADPHNPLRCPCGRGVRSPYAQGARPYESVVVVRVFLIGCAFLLLIVGCSGVRSGASKKEEQGSSPQATDSEEARCEGTRTIKVTWLQLQLQSEPIKQSVLFTTNDLPGCPNKGGLLSGTDKPDKLNGFDGDDEIRGLAGPDFIVGGAGNDVIHAGP